MQALQPLLALLEQTERERDDAQLHLMRLREAERAAAAQSDRLVAYRRDYDARWGARRGGAGAIEVLHCYQGFVGRLSLAVDQQARVAAHAADALAAAERTLREREQRVASVRKLIERRVAELRLAADRREQKQLDEIAARAAWRHGADAVPLHAA